MPTVRPTFLPAWRVFGAAFAGFAIGVQLVLSGFLIGHVAMAADPSALSIICGHDSGALAGGSEDGSGIPSGPASHDQCPACACPPSAKLFATPPAAPGVALLRPRSVVLQAYAGPVAGKISFHSPYASRAPPHSA
jgi:hypothetical protein